jgi:hypothetical protein
VNDFGADGFKQGARTERPAWRRDRRQALQAGSPWAGRSTIHACGPIQRISTSRVPAAARSHGSSA